MLPINHATPRATFVNGTDGLQAGVIGGRAMIQSAGSDGDKAFDAVADLEFLYFERELHCLIPEPDVFRLGGWQVHF